MITDMIKKDIDDEFVKLEKELKAYFKPNFDITQTKQFLQTHIPKAVVFKSEILFDTLLNYLMKNARKKIQEADADVQNAFYDADFRKRLKEKWGEQLENQFVLEPDVVSYSFDPRLKQGVVTLLPVAAVGTGVTLVLTPSMIGIIAGILTALFSTLAFKLAYSKASPQAREFVEEDVKQFLKISKEQVYKWLENAQKVFEKDFHDFCKKNGVVLQERSNV